MSTSTATTSTSTTRVRGRRVWSVIAATVAAVAVWFVAHAIAGDLYVGNGATRQAIGPVAVAVTSLVAGLVGWALLAGLERFTGRPRRIWTIIAVTVLLISLLGPAGGVDGPSRIGLAALHLVVGTILILTLRRTTR